MKLRVIIVEPEGEINVGFIARLTENFEVDELYIVNPKIKIGEEARRFAAKALHVFDNKTKIVSSLKEALQGVELSGCTSAIVGSPGDFLRHSISIEKFAELAMNYSTVALVFGRESVGLKREELSQCDFVVYIPASIKYSALNVSHAAAIALYEIFKRRSLGRLETLNYATINDLEIIDRYIDQLTSLVLSDKRQREGSSIALKRAMRKAQLTKTEAGLITVFLRKLLVRIKSCLEECGKEKTL